MFHVHKRYGAKQALVDATLGYCQERISVYQRTQRGGKVHPAQTSLSGRTGFRRADPGGWHEPVPDSVGVGFPVLRRKFGIIFQDYKLISTRTVYENVALVLEARGYKRSLIEKKVKSLLRVVDMEDRRMTAYPREPVRR
jgi:cell division transport system ATP-binding protein